MAIYTYLFLCTEHSDVTLQYHIRTRIPEKNLTHTRNVGSAILNLVLLPTAKPGGPLAQQEEQGEALGVLATNLRTSDRNLNNHYAYKVFT